MPDNKNPLPDYITSLLKPNAYDHEIAHIELIETHISWVILTGPFAYKIKKPVNLGFLDFSTLEKRHFYCDEELRLNIRLAPTIYLDVIPITGLPEHAKLYGAQDIIEYAIKMVQFPQDKQLDRMLSTQRLQTKHIDALAKMVAEFHQQAAIAHHDNSYGQPEKIIQPIKENFILLEQLLTADSDRTKLAEIAQWSQSEFEHLKPFFEQRKRDGFIRECHGDLHLRNLVFLNEKPVAFDCIEFDPELRWIDIINDIAFLIMDLQDRQQPDFAQRLLNCYLEKTGDYAAMHLLRFYLVYRAMVRAKVEAISATQATSNTSTQHKAKLACDGYLGLAQSYLQDNNPMLIITCGLSASGKSTLTLPLIEKIAMIRIRSDVERKRLFNITSDTNSAASFKAGIYSSEASELTYHHLTVLAALVLNAGYPVIIDAACLKYEQRALFRQLATEQNIPFIILEFTAQANTLRQRIKTRKKEVSDADLSILEQQLLNWQPLHKNELSDVITVDTESSTDINSLVSHIMLHYKEKNHHEQDNF